MNERKRFISFYDDCSDAFEEHLDGVRMYLQNHNEQYKRIKQEMYNIIDNNPNIQQIICNGTIKSELSIEESKLLAKVIILYIDLQYIVEKEMYFKGGTDAYFYFDKLGIVKKYK